MSNNYYNYLEESIRLKKDGFTRTNNATNIIKKLESIDLCSPELYMHKDIEVQDFTFEPNEPIREKQKNKKIEKGIKKIGKGEEGEVYIGCVDTSCNEEVAIKIGDTVEKDKKYLEKFNGITMNIPKVYAFKKCNEDKSVLYYEYFNGGDLFNVLKKFKNKMTVLQLRSIMFQIIMSLYLINKEHPTFRHNDLHIGNILLDLRFPSNSKTIKYKYGGEKRGKLLSDFYVDNIGVRAGITDFGFASMGKNNVDDIYKNTYGIYDGNSVMYDVHLFLNTLYIELKRSGFSSISAPVKFITEILPPEYLGKNTLRVKEFRLRPDMNHKIPSFKQILEHSFFVPFRVGRGNNGAVNSFPKNIYNMPTPIKKYSASNLLALRPVRPTYMRLPSNISSVYKRPNYLTTNLLVKMLPSNRTNKVRMVGGQPSKKVPVRRLELLNFTGGRKYTTKPREINQNVIREIKKQEAIKAIRENRLKRAQELLMNEAPYMNIFNNNLFEPKPVARNTSYVVNVPTTSSKIKKLFKTLKQPVAAVRPGARNANFRPLPARPIRSPPKGNLQKALNKLKAVKTNKPVTKLVNAPKAKNIIPMSINASGDLRIGTKLCKSLKKDDIAEYLVKKGIKKEQVMKLTKPKLCELVAKKYLGTI